MNWLKISVLSLMSLCIMAKGASAAPLMMCWPSQRDTRLYVESSLSDQKMSMYGFYVANPMGYDYMPQFDGPTYAASLNLQKMQFTDLKQLGDGFSVKWSTQDCQWSKMEMTMVCNGEVQTSDPEIKAVSFSTTQITEKSGGIEFHKLKYRLGLAKSGNTYFISLEYPQEKCKIY